ncbi:MAG: hypothetical protein M3Q85_12950, partial [Acidobacteriota bacterium]|nr:hypothetical protein [Acidobacteriota bacterium]
RDQDYLERLYVPGLRRAGDLQTAASAAGGTMTIHNAGERFAVSGPRVQRERLRPAEIVAALRAAAPGR